MKIAAAGIPVGALATLSLAGCSTGGETGASDNVELTVMIWDANQKDGVQKAIDGFVATHPGTSVKLNLVPADQYYTKLDASLAAGSGPDVMWQSSKAIDYIEGGALEPLDAFIEAAGTDLSQFNEMVTTLYSIDGKQYGLPKDMDTWVFILNTEIFARLGVAEPASDWTWDDMLAVAEELRKKGQPEGQVVYYNNALWNGVATLVHQSGGAVIKADGKTAGLDSDAGRNAFALLLDLVDKGYAPDTAKLADYNPLNSLLSGNLAMSAVPSWNISAVAAAASDGQFAAIRFPSVNHNFDTDTNGLAYTLNAASKHKDAGFELIGYLTSLEGARLHAQGGAGLPAIAEAQADWIAANKAVANIEVVSEAADHVFTRPSSAFPQSRPAIEKSANTVMPAIWARTMEVDEGIRQINDAIGSALN